MIHGSLCPFVLSSLWWDHPLLLANVIVQPSDLALRLIRANRQCHFTSLLSGGTKKDYGICHNNRCSFFFSSSFLMRRSTNIVSIGFCLSATRNMLPWLLLHKRAITRAEVGVWGTRVRSRRGRGTCQQTVNLAKVMHCNKCWFYAELGCVFLFLSAHCLMQSISSAEGIYLVWFCIQISLSTSIEIRRQHN